MHPHILSLALALASLLAPSPTPQVEHGYASSYGRYVTRDTRLYRQETGDVPADLDKWHGLIAVEDCGEIGETWWIKRPHNSKWRPVMVFDCAHRDNGDGTRTWMRKSGVILELGYPLAHEWGAVDGGIAIEAAKKKPPFGG